MSTEPSSSKEREHNSRRSILHQGRGGGEGGGGVGQFLRSVEFRNSILVHEIFELGGKIRHDPGGSEVKGPLEVLLLIKHPNVDLESQTGTEERSAF